MDPDDSSRTGEEYRINLLNDLLSAVKECQRTYGIRSELATELDSSVADICHCFEAIFNHGLRKNPTK